MGDDSSRLVTVASSSHHEILVTGLWNFFNAKHRVDFAFQGKGRSIRAHQLIVEVFLSPDKLGLSTLEDQSNVDDDRGGNLDSLLEFLYNGQVAIRHDELEDLLRVAKALDFKMLMDAVEAARVADAASRTKAVIRARPVGRRRRKGRPTKLLSTVAEKKKKKPTAAIEAVEVKELPRKRGRAAATRSRPPEPIPEESSAEEANEEEDDPSDESFNPGRRAAALLESGDSAGSDDGSEKAPAGSVEVKEEDQGDEEVGEDYDRPETDASPTKKRRGRRKKLVSGEGRESASALPKIDGRRLWLRRQPNLKCEHCSYETRRKNDFQVHLAKHNPSVTVFRCAACCKKFLSEATLERHKLSHAGEPEFYDCPHCDYKSRDKTRYKVHLSRHDSSVVIFRCTSCSRAFLDEEGLNRHKVTHVGEPEIHECPYCECKFLNKIWYQVHLSKHDPNVAVFPCDVCNRPYLSRDTLERHKSRHRIYSCPHCQFVTPKCVSYHHHLRSVHKVNARGEPAAKKFKCTDCSAAYMYESELKIHAVEKHSGAKPFKCDQCNFASGRKSDVPKHVKAVHLNIKPCLCDTCGYRCVSQSRLDQHRLKHTGEKPYKCETCQMSFGDRYTLKKHARLHVSDDKPFVCHVCGHAFNRRDNLKVHLKNVHKTPMDQVPATNANVAPVTDSNAAYGMVAAHPMQQPPPPVPRAYMTGSGFRNTDVHDGSAGWRPAELMGHPIIN